MDTEMLSASNETATVAASTPTILAAITYKLAVGPSYFWSSSVGLKGRL